MLEDYKHHLEQHCLTAARPAHHANSVYENGRTQLAGVFFWGYDECGRSVVAGVADPGGLEG